MPNITIPVELIPFDVPDTVTQKSPPKKREEFTSAHAFRPIVHPLSSLSEEALDALCNEFRRNVFERAGKTDPYVTEVTKRGHP